MKLISVVVPCYNEQEVFAESYKRLTETLSQLDATKYHYELIFVNDGSKDNTLLLINEAITKDNKVKGINFSRNFGHQIAITAGLDNCKGDCAVVIDADLQDPPAVILQMVQKWEEGYDVVFGKREERAGESAFKLITAKWFYRFINRLSDVDIPLDTGDFRLMDRNALNQFLSMRESYRFVRGMIAWIGFNQTFVTYDRESRFAGTTKYPFKKMLRLASDAILSFSNTPLKIATFVGFATSIVAFIGILYAIYMRTFTNNYVEGWTLLMISILMIGGIILLVLGIIGEYVGRIYGEIKQRPLYIIKDKIGF
ncbi:MAG: glycosyltransferase family 2 protein [Bacteroidetes bacterium]|nr:glycosyltransferase family 2 protein [Bacteroidota bacterium]